MELINKTALIDNLIGLKETCDQIGTGGQIRLDTFIKAVEEIPAVEAYPRWIPCSERLPVKPTENTEFDNKCLELYLVSEKNAKYPFRAFWNGKDFTDGFCKVNVTAWRPLPEPYEEE